MFTTVSPLIVIIDNVIIQFWNFGNFTTCRIKNLIGWSHHSVIFIWKRLTKSDRIKQHITLLSTKCSCYILFPIKWPPPILISLLTSARWSVHPERRARERSGRRGKRRPGDGSCTRNLILAKNGKCFITQTNFTKNLILAKQTFN